MGNTGYRVYSSVVWLDHILPVWRTRVFTWAGTYAARHGGAATAGERRQPQRMARGHHQQHVQSCTSALKFIHGCTSTSWSRTRACMHIDFDWSCYIFHLRHNLNLVAENLVLSVNSVLVAAAYRSIFLQVTRRKDLIKILMVLSATLWRLVCHFVGRPLDGEASLGRIPGRLAGAATQEQPCQWVAYVVSHFLCVSSHTWTYMDVHVHV